MTSAAPSDPAPAPLDVAIVFRSLSIDELRAGAADLGVASDVTALAGARCVSIELLDVDARARPCSSFVCAGSGTRGPLSTEHARLAHLDPIGFAMRCGACIEREVAHREDVRAFHEAKRRDLVGAAS